MGGDTYTGRHDARRHLYRQALCEERWRKDTQLPLMQGDREIMC
jgi:hypothetical protein